MDKAGMNGSRKAGTHRPNHRATLAALALLSHAGIAFAQVAAGGLTTTRATPAPRADTTRMVGTSQVIIVRNQNARLDSLLRRLNTLPVGSAEYIATSDSLRVVIEAPAPQALMGARGSG